MTKTDKICPIDGSKLHPNSGLYQGIWYDCHTCHAIYEPRIDFDKQARAYLSSLQADVQRSRRETERKEGQLERIIKLAHDNRFLEDL